MKLGIKSIAFTPQKNINLPFSTDTEAFKFIEEIEWTNIPASNISGTFEETTSFDKNGEVRNVTVTAVVVDKSGVIRKNLREIERDYVYLIEDMNGVQYLVGTNHYRSRLTYRHEIGKLDKNTYSIEITHQSPHGAIRSDTEIEQFVLLAMAYSLDIVNLKAITLSSFEMTKGELENADITAFFPEWISLYKTEEFPTGILYLDKANWVVVPSGTYNVVIYVKAEENTTGIQRQGNVTIQQVKSGKTIQVLLIQKP